MFQLIFRGNVSHLLRTIHLNCVAFYHGECNEPCWPLMHIHPVIRGVHVYTDSKDLATWLAEHKALLPNKKGFIDVDCTVLEEVTYDVHQYDRRI